MKKATFLQKASLLLGLLQGEKAAIGPFYVDIDLTARCNLRCVGCQYHSAHQTKNPMRHLVGKDLSLDFFKNLAIDLVEMKTKTLILQGSGEPLLNPKVSEMIAFAKSLGLQVVLLTNGTLLDEKKSRDLVASGLDLIKVSLWGGSPEQYRLNCPGVDPGNFERVVYGLKALREEKNRAGSRHPQVHLLHIINANNYKTLDTMVDLAVDCGCDGLLFSPMARFDHKLNQLALAPENEQAVKAVIRQAAKKLDRLSMESNAKWAINRYSKNAPLWQEIPCYIAWFHVRIRVDGTVQGCGSCDLQASFGSLEEQSFKAIWNGEAIREWRRLSMTREGMERLSKYCECESCCFYYDIHLIHKYFRWLAPLKRITHFRERKRERPPCRREF